MKLKFTKMHGLGNDFVVFDATRAPLELSAAQLRQIADRRFGVGCDQILQVEKPRDADTERLQSASECVGRRRVENRPEQPPRAFDGFEQYRRT